MTKNRLIGKKWAATADFGGTHGKYQVEACFPLVEMVCENVTIVILYFL